MNSKKTLLVFLSLILVFSLFLGACGKTEESATNPETPAPTTPTTPTDTAEPADDEPKFGGDLIYGAIGAPTLFNTLYSQDNASGEIERLIFDRLIESTPNFEPVPRMAERWEISEDGMTWTFFLKKGIKFHDGEDMTAEDVVFTYNIGLHEDYSGPRASSFEKITSLKALDDHTVEITLSEPFAPFIWQVIGSHGILPKHILGDVPVADLGEHEFNTKNPIGTGPYTFENWEDGQYVKLNAFDDYHSGRPYLDSVTYKIVPDQNSLLAQLQAGDIHLLAVPSSDVETVQEWEAQGQLKIASTLALSYTYLGYNLKNELFQDVNVRHAITHALNRDAIVAAVLNGDGQVAHAPSSPLSWAYNPDTPQFGYDPEKAKQLLADAGWTPGADGILEKDGKRFSFVLKTNQGNKAREEISVVVQQFLKEVGIEVEPRIVEWSAFIAEISPPNWNFDALILGWALGLDPDPTAIWHSKEREQGLNNIDYSRPELDLLMDENTKILDIEERKEIVWEIFGKIAEDQPYTFLYYPNQHLAMPTYMEGFIHHPRNTLHNLETWWFNN